MVRPKDPFWEYAEILENGRRFSCNFCHRRFMGGISRFKWHLSGLKYHDIKACEQVSPEIRLAVRQVLDIPIKKDRQVEYENCAVPSSSGSMNLSNSDNEKDKYQLLDKQLVKWFFSFDIRPEAIASPIFKDIVKRIGEYGSNYQLPSPDILKGELLADVQDVASAYVIDFISGQVQASCTLMVNHHIGCSFAYSPNGVACLGFFDDMLPSYPISKFIRNQLTVLGPSRVLQILIPNEPNWRDISREIELLHPRIILRCCAAEVVDGFLDCMKMVLQPMISFVTIIFCSYYRYNVSSSGGMKVPIEYSAFVLLMLRSVLRMEDELQDVSFACIIGSSEEVKLLGDGQEKASHFNCGKLLDYIVGHKEFWSGVKLVAEVWVLLFQTRCLVNLEDSNVGYLYQMIERLKDGIEKSREHDNFNFGWEFSVLRQKIIHPIHAVAAFLDPAYMCTDNFELNIEMRDGLNYMFENMIDSDEKIAFTKELEKYCMKDPELITAQAETMLKTCHPRKWWDLCGKHTVPVLSKYAIRILSQPCSILYSWRYYMDRGGYDTAEGGARRVNTMIMNENSRSSKLEPIILDRLGEDLGAFTDWTEQHFKRNISSLLERLTDDAFDDIKSSISSLLERLTDDAFVDCVINDSSPFWDNVSKYMPF